ncbi:MAG: c-type cytochrome [Methylotenera sp.]|nr:c-type cytochrome [Methylotenera sp.]MDO9233097.1 c-type cytochrome [Methylotenera sp.]MDO9389242.1 c-type cytochrome [Methylotenera sp.]MDP2102805.1 c-type cytochrome [Methylotenera sp.]MDP2282167.1 c-type cytochrome [Methylotenera sp.]
MQFRHLAWLMSSVILVVSVEALAEAPSTRTAEQIVNTVCAACHAPDGNSAISLNPKLAGQHPEYLQKQLTEYKSGKRANAVMSGMAAGLSDEEMKALAYYFSAKKLNLGQAKTNGAGSLGEKMYRAGNAANNTPACAACHGPTGAGLPIQFPRLGGQHADYTLAQLKAFRTGERGNAPMMMAITAKMTDAEMAAVADYIEGLR